MLVEVCHCRHCFDTSHLAVYMQDVFFVFVFRGKKCCYLDDTSTFLQAEWSDNESSQTAGTWTPSKSSLMNLMKWQLKWRVKGGGGAKE